MPSYDYKCISCHSRFTKVLPLSQYDEPQVCPECGHEHTTRVISGAPGVIFKGGGWATPRTKGA